MFFVFPVYRQEENQRSCRLHQQNVYRVYEKEHTAGKVTCNSRMNQAPVDAAMDTVAIGQSAFQTLFCQALHTSTQAVNPEYFSISATVSSMAELLLPAAGKTVAKRLILSSR